MADVARGSVLTEVEAKRAKKYITLWPCTSSNPQKAETNNQKQQRNHNTRRPANPPARFAFRRRANQTQHQQKRGQAQQKQPLPLWINCIRSGSRKDKPATKLCISSAKGAYVRTIKLIQNFKGEPVKLAVSPINMQKQIVQLSNNLLHSLRVLSVMLLQRIVISKIPL